MKKKIILLVILLAFGHLIFRMYGYMGEYLKPFDAKEWQDKYNKSQWVVVNTKAAIGDDGLYTHVAWEYITGRDPTTLNAELPPFGKYLIGLSELVFKNQNIFALLSGVFVLVGFYLLNVLLFKDKWLAALPVALFSFEPLFYTQLRAPFLDLLYLGLLLMTFYFFLRQKYIGSAIFLGLMSATKSTASTFPLIIVVLLLYLVLTRQYPLIKKYLFSLPVAGIVFLLTYFQFFLQGNSFIEFLSVQKWILNFYSSGAVGSPAILWEVLFTGSWHTWWGQVAQVSEWHIGWPILFILSVVSLFILIRTKHDISKSPAHKKNQKFALLFIWLGVYFIFLMIIPMWPRYLLLALPFMYNLAIRVLIHKV